MQYGKVEISGVNTAKLKTLTHQQKSELLARVKQGDKAAREELINGNLKLVLSVIQRFSGRGEHPDDLFQVGCVGLIKAIDNFDDSHGVKLSTYAVPMIIGEIRRFLRDNNPIRVSRSTKDLAYKAMQVKEKLTAELGHEPTVEQIAKQMELPKEDVVIALESLVSPVSLYEPVFSDSGDTLYIMDQVSDHSDDTSWLNEIAMKDAIRHLGEREKQILSLRFYDGKTQMEVADLVGISQAQVSRLEKGAISAMRKSVTVS